MISSGFALPVCWKDFKFLGRVEAHGTDFALGIPGLQLQHAKDFQLSGSSGSRVPKGSEVFAALPPASFLSPDAMLWPLPTPGQGCPKESPTELTCGASFWSPLRTVQLKNHLRPRLCCVEAVRKPSGHLLTEPLPRRRRSSSTSTNPGTCSRATGPREHGQTFTSGSEQAAFSRAPVP